MAGKVTPDRTPLWSFFMSQNSLPQALISDTFVAIGGPVLPNRAGARATNIAILRRALPDLMDAYEINTPLRMAHFLSQLAHESDSFCTFEEYASGAAYEGRQDLGNIKTGDGRRFKGRGPIQLTGRANYRAFTAWIRKQLPGIVPNFEAQPELLVDESWVAWSAIYFWTTRRLNEAADRDDVIAVTRTINGGRNGLADRKEKLARAKAAVARLIAAGTATPFSKDWPVLHRGLSDSPDVERLQSLLIHHGARIGIDGDFGPATELALKNFQSSEGIRPTGIADPATWAALRGA
jgi:putative chitinase